MKYYYTPLWSSDIINKTELLAMYSTLPGKKGIYIILRYANFKAIYQAVKEVSTDSKGSLTIVFFDDRAIQLEMYNHSRVFVYFLFYFIFCLFRAASLPYGHSQARGPVGAVTPSLRQSHSNEGSELCL